ncbi:uncharacterized protein TRAVEDRAFT_133930 [Trametes versicolor FP-101664 SS1]|uniref:uncharacterized protein n=1 Tax=Trametes versicolor (strain FP-101664) TaxID=717944 RepID=UPI0004622383|nr:uncharacterized protein TRAVEDRAFT_133930 [Trametes versicolor FP-101664 SS1]EIW53686.1 hypothetical protein TRAVEDRAFT_133930 [Trametes versicolor FP-101664 SS1]
MSPKFLPSQKTIPDDRPYRNSKKGNLIIRSADGVEFYVERAVIAHLSPIFQDMFSIPSPSDAEAKPVVDVTEPGVVWDALLGFCHFLPSDPFPSLSTIRALLEAARKYRMSAVEEWMRNTLLQSGYAETQALRTYAIACAYGLSDVALVAARGCIGLSDDHGGTKELELITALQYTRLGDFHKRCGSAAALAVSVKINSLPGWLTVHGAWLGPECAAVASRHNLVWHKVLRGCVDVPRYWVEYMQGVSAALQKRLDPSVARDPALVRPAVEAGLKCARCAPKIYWDMEEFAKLLEEAIEEAISLVSIDSPNFLWICPD